jgi:hypothetical protein
VLLTFATFNSSNFPLPAPDGLHAVVNQGNKMLEMYRVEELSSNPNGQYSLYGEIEKFTFTSDSVYAVMSIADTRLFFLMLCDIKVEGHMNRVKVLVVCGTWYNKRYCTAPYVLSSIDRSFFYCS